MILGKLSLAGSYSKLLRAILSEGPIIRLISEYAHVLARLDVFGRSAACLMSHTELDLKVKTVSQWKAEMHAHLAAQNYLKQAGRVSHLSTHP